ncbi:hypothetical protein F5I97DRAFT_769309 [Phlebopus sp. FC_14]|nr:hypothetical protein F5I97DRAFT_769309 [Phlebopus sp. FC_14]
MTRRRSSSGETLPSYEQQRRQSPNVIIFGETGVGKSSLVNLIAGDPLADTSSGAAGCTLEAQSYDLIFPDEQDRLHHVRLFDTVGLNEPSMGKNHYLTAVEKVNELMCELERTGGIRLLIFCFRGGRITAATQNNYRLFREILCQNEVPMAFVITGLENEASMEDWWTKNVAEFERCEMRCDAHACVTAHRGLENVYARKYEESQKAIRAMLCEHTSSTKSPWKPEPRAWFVHTAGGLLKWLFQAKPRGRHARRRRNQPLTEGELARKLEDRCGFARSEAVYLAGRIWIERHVDGLPNFVKDIH